MPVLLLTGTVVELEEVLETAALEDFVIENDGAPRDVAMAVLLRVGWI